jgi:hypothetical protein
MKSSALGLECSIYALDLCTKKPGRKQAVNFRAKCLIFASSSSLALAAVAALGSLKHRTIGPSVWVAGFEVLRPLVAEDLC